MPRIFWTATAEQVVAVVDAVVANKGPTSQELVEQFSDLLPGAAEAALNLAVDLSLLRTNGSLYETASPLCRFVSTPSQAQRAAVIRVVIEGYGPFVTFRERLTVAPVADAAEQTKALLDLDKHREDVATTLLSLGQYSQALVAEGGGKYKALAVASNPLVLLAETCTELIGAEARVREHIGAEAVAAVDREEVIVPLAEALVKTNGDPGGAVRSAANAIEAFLVRQAAAAGAVVADVTSAPGVNAKIEKYLDTSSLPKKLGHVGKYLGHIRNAADHAIDAEVGAIWAITPETGVQYVFVACSFVASTIAHINGKPPQL